jgi:hypothetical protein
LGVSLADDFIRVSYFQLLSGDLILNGPDGREEIGSRYAQFLSGEEMNPFVWKN